MDNRTIKQLEFIAERIRRRSYSPQDVERSLLGLPIPKEVKEMFMLAAANKISEKPVYPVFQNPKPKPKREKYAIIVFSTTPEYDSEGRAWHTYWGGDTWNRRFVKSFDGKNIEITREEKEAYKFKDDHECDECMAKLIREKNAFTIALWEKGSQMVHYPGEHWWNNDFLIPSFINRKGVNDFFKENIRFSHRNGWEHHVWEEKEKY